MTPEELAAIEARYSDSIVKGLRPDTAALIAEVRRLQAEIIHLEKQRDKILNDIEGKVDQT